MDRQEFRKFSSLALEDLEKDPERNKYLIRTTSGTSGDSPLFIVRKRKYSSRNFYTGLNRVMGFFGVFNARLAHANTVLSAKRAPKVLFLDYNDLDSNLDALAKEFRPDSLCGFPSFVIKALNFIKDPDVLSGIKYLRFTGESLTPAKIQLLNSALPGASIELYYAAAEVGFISQFCPHLPIGLYHPREGCDIDIINQDEKGIGEIVINIDLSPSVTVSGYQIGDVGRFIDHNCPCGNHITFEVLGRKDFDFIKLCGTILSQKEFDRVMIELKDYILDYKGTVREIAVGSQILGVISLHIVPTEKAKDVENLSKFLAQKISENLFVTATQTLDRLIEGKVFLPLVIEIKDKLEKGHKDVKLARIY